MGRVVISGLEWDDDNIFHVERHAFTPEEVEEVVAGDHKIRRTRQKRFGRDADLVRVITARNMEPSERRLFRLK